MALNFFQILYTPNHINHIVKKNKEKELKVDTTPNGIQCKKQSVCVHRI